MRGHFLQMHSACKLRLYFWRVSPGNQAARAAVKQTCYRAFTKSRLGGFTRKVMGELSRIQAVGAGGVQPLRKCLHQIEEPLEKVLERREAVIKILERDAHEAHQRAAHALGTRKVLWTLLGECSPLLHQLECNDRESEEQLNSLLQRIDDARAVVQAEELPGSSHARP